MFASLGMSTREKTIQEERIAKKKESNSITTLEITDFLQVDLESK